MADDIRELLHDAAPERGSQPDFDRLWNRAQRQRRLSQVGGVAAGIVVLAGTVLGVGQLLPATPTLEVTSTPNGCPVTIPDRDFVPPAPYPEQPASDGGVWYGSSELWTVLDADGDYLPRKSVWWSEHFEGGNRESEPEISVTWERLDDPDASSVTVDEGTNAHTLDDGWFMIAGGDQGTDGCWRVTASYAGAELSYVYLVEPSDLPEVNREQLGTDEFQVLAASATNDPSLEGTVFGETDGAQSLWAMADVPGTAPVLPEGTLGVFVVARDAESTCRSSEDVIGVEIVDGMVVVVLDPDGDFLRPCPGPSGAHAFTAFTVAIPDQYDDGLTGAESRLGERSPG
ncbi:MAG: hypothetical protein WEB03_13585 [Nitriliruptor sp.]|uniref:hypothetical protein n=1 Tax=Nitriliruptor sp. TaxID=2448056 RepID=UPI0034A009E5